MASTINVLLTTFPGLGLPATLSLPLTADLSISSFADLLSSRLPQNAGNLILTTTSNQRLDSASPCALSSLTSSALLPLRLTSALPGGKGGFGSQLRAAGGRMASRKNRKNGDTNGSNRNLDGRRLRTVTEAKNLAAYLATKPEMDRKEKEERRRRLEAIVESAERREEEIKTGKKGVKLDGEWIDRKEEEEGKTREAVAVMLKIGVDEARTGSESDDARVGSEEMDEDDADEDESSDEGEAAGRSFYGWDEEDMSEDEEEDEDDGEAALADSSAQGHALEGKGKGRA